MEIRPNTIYLAVAVTRLLDRKMLDSKWCDSRENLSVFINHSREYGLSFSLRICRFESNATSGVANQKM